MRALVLIAYGLLGLSWAMTNPPFASPDEGAHFLRAVGLSDGAWVGTPASDPNPALTPKQRAWSSQATRRVVVPAGLSPESNTPCMSGRPAQSAACLDAVRANRAAVTDVTSVGTYQPLPYLLPAATVRMADSAGAADRLGRLATLAVWLALLGAAVWLLWDAAIGIASLAGLLLAITPQVVFVGVSLTGSSLEIAASCAFFAALLRIARTPQGAPRAAWIVAGSAGALLALSRAPGPVWVLLGVGLWAVLAGRTTLAEVWRHNQRRAALTIAALIVGIGLNRSWEARHGPDVETSLLPPWESLKAGRRELTGAADELVGNFGYLDTPLGTAGVVAWGLLTAGLIGVAAWHGRRRERRVLLAVAAVVALAPIYLFAAVTRFTGFGLQGRHVLALAVILPLVAGEILRRRAVLSRWIPLLAGGVAAVQLLAWWTNSRRYAVGSDGSWWFLADAEWSPPAGWWLWLVVTCAGAAAIVLSARRT